MTLNRLRFYYILLAVLDQWLWLALADAVPLTMRVLAGGLRLFLLVLALAPHRFRLLQVRALRFVSLYAFATGACAAWSARAGMAGEGTWWLPLPTPEACNAAYALSAACVVVLVVNAVILPRTRWL